MDKIINYIKEQDIFGHTITLNFDQEQNSYQDELGKSYQTLFGGFFSTLIKIFCTFYVCTRLKILVSGEDPYLATVL